MSGPTRVRPACNTRLMTGGKRTLRGGRMNAWSTYRTEGKGAGASGFEPDAKIHIVGVPAYLVYASVYLVNAANSARFIQIFDCPDLSAIVQGSPWNPDLIYKINPGQTLGITPPKERASFNWDPGPGGVLREDDAGYPFDRGILFVDSTSDTDIVAGPADELRLVVRYLVPSQACV